MIKRIVMGLVALLVLAAIVVGGVYLWNTWKKSKELQPSQTEVKLPLATGSDQQGGNLVSDLGPGTESDSFANVTGLQARTAAPKGTPVASKGTPVPKKPATGAKAPAEGDIGNEPAGLSSDLGTPATREVAQGTTKEQRPARPVSTQTAGQPPTRSTPKPGARLETIPVGTPTAGAPLAETPSEGTSIIDILPTTPTPTPQQTPQPTATPNPAATPTPTLTPLPTPVPGNYNVRTLAPVFESQLAAVRAAMKSLGVFLQVQKAGRQELAAYRIAVGYFQTKGEAESWAQYNFRPNGIKYYVYPTQGMYSLQIGIYSQQENIEPAMREFYRRYQGGRLPIREEITTFTTSVYQLAINQISKSLAEKVWDRLTHLRIQAEISGM